MNYDFENETISLVTHRKPFQAIKTFQRINHTHWEGERPRKWLTSAAAVKHKP